MFGTDYVAVAFCKTHLDDERWEKHEMLKRNRFAFRLLLALSVLVSGACARSGAQTDAKTLAHLKKQAQGGDISAQNELGNMYNFGDGVKQDYAQALFWYRKAAEKGNAYSQFQLGGLYHFGHGARQDDREAFAWVMKAAQQGNWDAEFYISTSYSVGWGVPKDDVQSANWLRKAGTQGDARSQFYLGIDFEAGQGVPQDYSEAYFWLELATTGDITDREKMADVVEERDRAASHLTDSELSKVQIRLQRWVRDHPVQSQ